MVQFSSKALPALVMVQAVFQTLSSSSCYSSFLSHLGVSDTTSRSMQKSCPFTWKNAKTSPCSLPASMPFCRLGLLVLFCFCKRSIKPSFEFSTSHQLGVKLQTQTPSSGCSKVSFIFLKQFILE